MKLDTYTCDDLNMYLSGTFISIDGKPHFIESIRYLDDDGDTCSDCEPSMARFYLRVYEGDQLTDTKLDFEPSDSIKTISVPLGYRNYKNTAVFLYHVQQRHYKKLPTLQSVNTFNPQSQELEHLREYSVYPNDSEIRKLLLLPIKYPSLEEAFNLLQNKKHYAVALHKNYALVKKAKHKDLTIYYKTDPVLTYNGSDLTALVDDCHINKFLLEVQP